MAFQNDCSFSIFIFRNDDKLVLNCIYRVSDLLLFAHQVGQVLLSMHVFSKGEDFRFLFLPFLLRHLLKPVNTELFCQLGPSFVDSRSFLNQVVSHALEVKFLEKQDASDV